MDGIDCADIDSLGRLWRKMLLWRIGDCFGLLGAVCERGDNNASEEGLQFYCARSSRVHAAIDALLL